MIEQMHMHDSARSSINVFVRTNTMDGHTDAHAWHYMSINVCSFVHADNGCLLEDNETTWEWRTRPPRCNFAMHPGRIV